MAKEQQTIKDYEDKIKRLIASEDRPDDLFRAILALSQLGDMARYITHDPKLNPKARPYGSDKDELLACGQMLVQTMGLAVARGISIEEALAAGLKNWQDRDWQKREAAKDGVVVGRVVVEGKVKGRAYVVSTEHPLEGFLGGVLVASFIKPAQANYLREKVVTALVTDQGGVMSHPAVLAREMNIVCIVGTGNATTYIPHEAMVMLEAKGKDGFVKVVGQ